MKILGLVAASGPTGQQVLRYALERGLGVNAIVRDPSKITVKHEHLKIFKANVFDPASLAPAIEGCSAVVSCLGGMPGLSTVTLYSEATKAIVEAMRQQQVDRLVVMSAAYCKDDSSHPIWIRWGLRAILGRLFDDIVRMESYLQEHCQDIRYTSVRPPYLNNEPLSESPLKIEESYYIKDAAYGTPRANVANFILDALDTELYDRKFMAIAL